MKVEETLEQVLEALKASESMLSAMVQDKIVTAEKLTTLEVKLENIEKDVGALVYSVRGNGQSGLITRVSLIEDHVVRIDKDIATGKASDVANRKGRWVIYAALVTGGLSLITAVVTTLLR